MNWLVTDAIRNAARSLYLDAYWTDDRERAFDHQNLAENLEQRYTPDLSRKDWEEGLLRVAMLVGKIEQAWVTQRGTCRNPADIPRVAAEMVDCTTQVGVLKKAINSLVYRAVMAAIGHGIGPDDDGKFPKDLTACLVNAENPFIAYC